MRKRRGGLWVAAVAVMVAMPVAGSAAFIDEVTISEWAGTGDNTAYVVIDFADGAEYAFGVCFDGQTTGDVIHHLLDDETGLEVEFQDYGFGELVTGLSYDGHSNSGYGGGDDWWHYWISDDGESWTSPEYGISDRVVVDGSWDGWVYGSAGEPIPEPTTAALLFMGGVLLRRRLRG